MKTNQVNELNHKVAALLTEYGVQGNYALSYILIDEDTGDITAPTIANATGVPDYGVSKPRATVFLAEVLLDTLMTMLRSYTGLDIFGAAGALKGMIDEARSNQLMHAQMKQARRSSTPVA